MAEWKDVLKITEINPDQRNKILKGKENSHAGKVRLLNIFGKIPDSIWNTKHTKKIDLGERSQHKISEEHRNDTLKIFDNSTRNQNVRWEGAISMFPRNIVDQLLDFYTEKGDNVLDLCAGHNSRLEPTYIKGRNYTGVDISIPFMKFNNEVKEKLLKESPNGCSIKLYLADSRHIKLPENYYDFHFTSPPYYCIEDYGNELGQLGKLGTYEDFMEGMTEVYKNVYKSLKPGKFCIINVNDFRKGGQYYSYHVDTVNALKSVGFRQYDMVIMRYPNSMRKCFPNQIWEEKLMPKAIEYLIICYKPPKYPHSAVYPFKTK